MLRHGLHAHTSCSPPDNGLRVQAVVKISVLRVLGQHLAQLHPHLVIRGPPHRDEVGIVQHLDLSGHDLPPPLLRCSGHGTPGALSRGRTEGDMGRVWQRRRRAGGARGCLCLVLQEVDVVLDPVLVILQQTPPHAQGGLGGDEVLLDEAEVQFPYGIVLRDWQGPAGAGGLMCGHRHRATCRGCIMYRGT